MNLELIGVTELERERAFKELLLEAIETAIISGTKNYRASSSDARVELNDKTGKSMSIQGVL